MEIQKFHLSDFYFDDCEKRGSQACIFKGWHSHHGEVAIKQWFHDFNEKIEEIKLLMQNTFHENIIQFIGILIDNESTYIGYIMSYMPTGSLHDVIHDKSKKYDQNQINSWISKISSGLSYLHSNKIIHRNIKPSNVLLTKSCDDVKLSDFGMTQSLKIITQNLAKRIGTPVYMAPEIIKGEDYNISVDIYSLSITIWEILHRKTPFDHVTDTFDLLTKIPNGERPKLKDDLLKDAFNFLKICWHVDASLRPTIDDVLKFSKSTGFSFTNLENAIKGNKTSFEDLTSFSGLYNCIKIISVSNHDEVFSEVKETLSKQNKTTQIRKTDLEKETILVLGGIDNDQKGDSLLTLPNYIIKFFDRFIILQHNGENWKELKIKLPYTMYGHGAQFLNNNLYVFGGKNEKGETLNCTYKLPKSLQWEEMDEMIEQRYSISNSNVILNGKIWVLGGYKTFRKDICLNTVEMYNPETNDWKYMGSMNKRRAYAAAAAVNGKIFCCGGFDEKNSFDSAECYDLSSNVWTLICNMPQGIWGHGAAEMDGNLIVMGGRNREGEFNSVWSLDTTDKNAKWIAKPSMLNPCVRFSTAKIDGKIFVCGGRFNDLPINDTEIFDGRVWNNGPGLLTPRNETVAVVIPIDFAKYLK